MKEKFGERVSLTYVDTGERFKSAAMWVSFILPLTEDAYKYTLLSSLFNCGCEKYPTQRELAIRLEELYGADIIMRNSKSGNRQVLSFMLDLLCEGYTEKGVSEDCIDLLFEVIEHPYMPKGNFCKEYLEREKKLQIEKIKAKKNNKTSYAISRLGEVMCEGETIGIGLLGTIEQVEKIGSDDIAKAYQNLIRESQIEITYAGNTDYQIIKDKVKAFSGRIKINLIQKSQDVQWKSVDSIRYFSEELDMVQGRLSLGFRLKSGKIEDRATRLVLCQVLAYSPVSRLFMNVREKYSLCYYCRFSLDNPSKTAIISSGLQNDKFDLAKNAILHEIQSICEGDITCEELDCAKKCAKSEIDSIKDSAVSLSRWHLLASLTEDNSTDEELKMRISNINKEDVAAAARCLTLDSVMTFIGTKSGEEINDD